MRECPLRNALTFRDLHTLQEHGFELSNGNTLQEINVSSPYLDVYQFDAIAPNVPFADRLWRVAFWRTKADPWGVSWRDRRWATKYGSDTVYAEGDQNGFATLSDALDYLRRVPWHPSPERLVELLRDVEGTITCTGGLLTFPDGSQVPLPRVPCVEESV